MLEITRNTWKDSPPLVRVAFGFLFLAVLLLPIPFGLLATVIIQKDSWFLVAGMLAAGGILAIACVGGVIFCLSLLSETRKLRTLSR